MAADDFKDQLRNTIQSTIARAVEEGKKKRFSHRLDIAKKAFTEYEERKIPEAVRSFHQYLKMLEEHTKCGEGKLSPTYFDIKEDIAELLLISGVYWDLAKLYDRTKTQRKREELIHYLDKFVLFSKGMPYEPLCRETVRKYLQLNRTVHRADFQKTYKDFGQIGCFVATAVSDLIQPQTLGTLQQFRDQKMAKTRFGRGLIDFYYAVGPSLAAHVSRLPMSMRRTLAFIIDRIAQVVERLSK